MTRASGVVQRVIYQEIYQADIRKLQAKSADAPTGGGARDFRFPANEFGPMFRRLFPDTRTVQRRRDGQRVDVEINVGEIHWIDEDRQTRSTDVTYEPPTSARPSEDRLARVHKVPPLDLDNIPPTSQGVLFVLFVQDARGHVWAYYISEQLLRASVGPEHADGGDVLDPDVAEPIIRCLDAPARKDMKRPPRVQGYIDLTTKQSYCHGI